MDVVSRALSGQRMQFVTDVFNKAVTETDDTTDPGAPAPRVEVRDGKMVIVESSLVVEAPKSQPVELDVVYESQSRVTSASYSNRQSVDRWSMKDTQLLYKALSQYGTDFQLIAQLFPKRNRKQVKAKFKKEEKLNTRLIDQALKTRLPIGSSHALTLWHSSDFAGFAVRPNSLIDVVVWCDVVWCDVV